MNRRNRAVYAPLTLTILALVSASCASVDQADTLASQRQRIEDLSANNAALAGENRELKAQNAQLEAREDAAREALDQAAAENRQLQELVEANARQRMLERDAQRRVAELERPSGEGAAPEAKEAAAGRTEGQEAPVREVGLADEQPQEGGVVEAPARGLYHLRIISLPANDFNAASVREIARWLTEDKQIPDVVARRSGDYWVVDIGHFQSIRDADAVALKHAIRGMRYRGVTQFRSAYFAKY